MDARLRSIVRHPLLLAGAALLVLAPGSALAKRSPDQALRALEMGERAVEPTVRQADRRVEVESGMPRALYRQNHPVEAASPEAMAREYLRDVSKDLRLGEAAGEDLEVSFVRQARAGTTVRFRQTIDGIPVHGAEIAVSIDPQNRVQFVMNDYVAGASLATRTPSVSADAARSAALAHLGVVGALGLDRTELVALPTKEGVRLAWKVNLVPSETPTGDWEVLADAATGELLRVTDNACYVDGDGDVFDPDPLSSAGATYNDPGYTDGADANTAQLLAEIFNRTLPDITFDGANYQLTGPYARIMEFESPNYGSFGQATSSFVFTRFDNPFEAANVYYHVDRYMRYINETLGLSVMPFQYAGGVQCDPHGLSGADNSHYIPSTGRLAWGEGGVDDSEDADVIIHELGHGLHDWVTGGSLSQVNGLSEGTGDYFAQSYSRAYGQWTPADPAYHWTFSWDGHNTFWGGRITNYGATYPGGLTGSIHTDGQIWATSLMHVWDDIGQGATDAAVLEGLAMTNSSSSQDDAAQAVLQAAINLGYDSTQLSSFVTRFQNTGYSISLGLDYAEHLGDDGCVIVIVPGARDGGDGIWEPGELIQLEVSVTSSGIPHASVSGVLSTSTPGVTIVTDSANWPNIGAGGSAVNSTPFEVLIDDTFPCFDSIDFDLVVTSDQGPFPMSFSQPVGSTSTPPGLPIAIPDGNATGVQSVLNIGEDVSITDLNIRVQITHTYVGDLFIKLRSPLGTEVTLLDRPGVPASTFGCSNDNMNVTFDDASAVNLESYCAGANPWYDGVAAPVGSLAAFNGQSTQGNWILTVSDNAGADTGSIVDWELLSTPAVGGTCVVCEATATGSPVVSAGTRFSLSPARPNPSRGGTEIAFSLARSSATQLSVFDVSGRRVATLISRDLAAGPHRVTWDSRDEAGNAVAAGVYFYRLTSGTDTAMERMTVLR